MNRSHSTLEFGPFRLDPDKRLLLRDGEPVALAPKAFETLLALIEQPGRVITKDELLQRIWGDTVVEEGGLTRNISILRKALGEKPDDHQYVVTIPGRGYQFVANVHERPLGPQPVHADGQTEVRLESAAEVAQSAGAAASVVGSPEGWGERLAFLPQVAAVAAKTSSIQRRLLLAGLMALVAGALVFALRLTPATNAERPLITAIAVLPLENLSDDPSQEYFVDGMTEALIGSLARIRALRVVSRTSVMRFKGAAAPLAEIARALNVDAVLEGSVQRTSDRVRVSLQLIHAPTDAHLWSREYERELTDVLKLQSDVARAVADEVQARVTAEERARLASAGSVTPAAYHEFLLGQHYLWRLNEEDLARAVGHFEQSVRLDPSSAASYAGLSHAWWWRGIWGATTFKQVESPSRAAAVKALELDPGLPEAHVSMGRLKFGHEWDWSGAEQAFSRALAIDPNNVDAHFFSAMLCMAIGCFPDAIDHMKRVEERDPLSSTVQSFFGRVLYRARRYDEAIIHLNRAVELDPQSPAGAYGRLADVYQAVGNYDEALTLLEKAASVEGRPRNANETVAAARTYALMGKRKEAIGMLKGSRGSNPHLLAMAYTALGDHDEAFRLLFRVIEDPSFNVYIKTDPAFDPLHSDARWQEVLRRMNHPQKQ
jgi:TolB-like protein/DNA-binding winged helix-turn-helix (wHTH) protein/lipopolysaccharide biosynthesis regulator YciM